MGNDVVVSNPYCIARNSSYALNANVDSLVTSVSINHPTAIEKISCNGSISFDPQQRTVTSTDRTICAMSLYNANGMLLATTRSRTLQLAGLSKGTYVVKAERHSQPVISRSIIINE